MLEVPIQSLSNKERLAYFVNDKWAQKLMQVVRTKYAGIVTDVYAVDVYRNLYDNFMNYIVIGLPMDRMEEVGRAVLPNYTKDAAGCHDIPFFIAWGDSSPINSDEFIRITDLEENYGIS